MKKTRRGYTRGVLIFYDAVLFLCVTVLILGIYRGNDPVGTEVMAVHGFLALLSVLLLRYVFGVYREILRYGGVQCYLRLMASDAAGFALYCVLSRLLPIARITFAKSLSLFTLNLLLSLLMRMMYRYCYKASTPDTATGRFLGRILYLFSGIRSAREAENRGIKVAIFGAGDLGNSLYDDICVNRQFPFEVRCFIDEDWNKSGRMIGGVKVLSWEDAGPESLKRDYSVDEVIVAVRNIDNDKLAKIYSRYTSCAMKVKTYDVLDNTSLSDSKRALKEVEVEDLLFRKPVVLQSEQTRSYYSGKTVLITGGGGSIGSELARQTASFSPRTLIILDICENTSYDLQMEMRMKYGNRLDFRVEICSITNRRALERVFGKYRIDIVINAAAHKHVPLMEDNPEEAVLNNVFGCLNLLDMTEKYGVGRFMMVSTDKAVNPTNVMGATKRMCEMMVLSRSVHGNTVYSITRFGNVLGSAGSVIPLFKKQILQGGPVTVTDRRITRYFMTIPEASQLVLESGCMAHNGELFVLDMGQPVKIIDLAENMIRLTGAKGIEIVETGLRPGEKLYEELLMKSGELSRTANSLIFIEKDEPLPEKEMDEKLGVLKNALEGRLTAEEMRSALRSVVPTYRRPEEVNSEYCGEKKGSAL